ncbi:MAG: hypothetical protein E6J90_18220 [Deltaproteobacteria bacterium]|nr:MAG: hypothetical protein E6J90_18220 [Deltaproteobacteria bacterium]
MRACSSLAVAMLVPSVALAAPPASPTSATSPASPASDDAPHVAANVVIDLAPAPGVPAWFASSFEQTITRELAGFERLGTIAKQDVAQGACGADRTCRLRTYRGAGVDIVLFGSVADNAIAYELFQTWTPARLDTGTIAIGRHQSLVGLAHATRDALHVVLKHGGLLDQKPYLEREPATAGAAGAAWSGRALEILLAVLALLVLPFGLALLGGEAPATLVAMRSARRVALVIAAGVVAVVALDPRRIGELVTAWAPLVAGIGGLGWGAFLVLVVRTAFPPLDGLERVPQRELGRFLSTWCLAALERLAVLAVGNAPLVVLVAWLGASLAIAPQWIYLVLAPAVVWLARLWFASWVECVAARLDRRIVEGAASHDSPWSREITDYLMGYVRRTGWDLDPRLLAKVVFLPGKQIDGVVSYGGGPTRARIVIDRELLVMALGPLLDDKPDARPARWPDWTVARIGPNPGGRSPSAAPSPHDVRGRRQNASYPGVQRKPLGQAATLLGYVAPAPGQLVPLISDSPQDLAIVRELLSEHYPWFAPDPDEEYDATDPTDKDLLFGALVRELGAVRRNETQLATLRLALGRRVARVTLGVRARLAYLYYAWTRKTDALTARARPARLQEVSTRILAEVSDPQARPPRAIRARLTWLSQFFAEPIVDRRGRVARRLAAGAAMVALLVAAGIAVRRTLAYHPTYVERINAQERDLKKGPVDGETKAR